MLGDSIRKRGGQPNRKAGITTTTAVTAVAVAVLLSGVVGAASRRSTGSHPSKATVHVYESPRPIRVAGTPTSLYADPDSLSQVLVTLPKGSITYAVAERTADETKSWIKIRAKSGVIGWCQHPCGDALTVTEAESIGLWQQRILEEQLQETVRAAAVSAIKGAGLHGGNPPEEVRITAPLRSESATSYVAPVSALMHGAVLLTNKYKVDVAVTLYLQINRDYPPDSDVRVIRTEILSSERTSGIGLTEGIRLLAGLGLF